MTNFEREQKCLKTYQSSLFEEGQEVQSIYHLLNTTKLKFDSCLNHLAKPIVSREVTYPFPGKTHCVRCGVIQNVFNVLSGESEDSVTLNKIKQNIYFL